MNKQFPCPVTTIFSRRVRPGFEDQYENWLAGISRESSRFPGNQGTTNVRPGDGRGEYITFVQFDATENLDRWLNSEERASWLAKLESITLDSEEVSSLTGMERWFTLPDRSVTQAPPKYKSALLVILGLYPIAMLLRPLFQFLFQGWPIPLAALASMVISVSLMVWVVMPLLTRLFFRWLYPSHARPRIQGPGTTQTRGTQLKERQLSDTRQISGSPVP